MSFMVKADEADRLNEVLWDNGFRYAGLGYTHMTRETVPYVLYERRADTTEMLVYFTDNEFLVDAVHRNEEDEEETNFELLNNMATSLHAKGVETRRGV